MAWPAIIAGAAAIIGGGLSYLGSKKQADALRSAGETESARQLTEIEFKNTIYEEGAPFREAAREALGPLKEDILAERPGESPLFQRGLNEGIENIQTQLAKYGLTDSTASGKAIGEFTSGLTALDMENIRNRRFQLAGYQGASTGQTLAASGLVANTGRDIAGLQIAQGANRAGLYGSLGQTVAALPLQYQQYRALNRSNTYNSTSGVDYNKLNRSSNIALG